MRKIWNFTVIILLLCALPLTAYAQKELVPSGQVVGLQLENGSVTVVEVAPDSPAQKAGIQPGDCILRLDAQGVSCAQDIKNCLKRAKGSVQLDIRRGTKEISLSVAPEPAPDGPRLGIYLKEGITGIGTVTYYDPDTGSFGVLGHGVNDPTGTLANMTAGKVYPARIQSVRQGKVGTPGQLLGGLSSDAALGQLYRNTSQGIFGESQTPFSGKALPIAQAQEVTAGSATILSTIAGSQPQEYSVEILKIYAKDRPNGRNLLIQVTDPRLLSATGGIVQGMSGSPIIQNGKLIGAVTHVLVNDPTTGYGIFIENMLDAAA